jgi:hypothetical protein
MSFPFGNLFDSHSSNIIVDENIPKGSVYLFNPKYKDVPVGTGEPPKFRTEIDWDATAKASALIYNIGDKE